MASHKRSSEELFAVELVRHEKRYEGILPHTANLRVEFKHRATLEKHWKSTVKEEK